jgi:hypothetical protein
MSTVPSHVPDDVKQRTLLTVPQFAAKHQAFTIGSLRWLIFNREKNGFATAILKCGRRILIDEAQFFASLDAMQNSDLTSTVKKQVTATPLLQQHRQKKSFEPKSR